MSSIFTRWFKKGQPAPAPAPFDPKEMAEAVLLEARITAACSKYGRQLQVGMPLREAFGIIADCLEEGVMHLPKQSRKVKGK